MCEWRKAECGEGESVFGYVGIRADKGAANRESVCEREKENEKVREEGEREEEREQEKREPQNSRLLATRIRIDLTSDCFLLFPLALLFVLFLVALHRHLASSSLYRFS